MKIKRIDEMQKYILQNTSVTIDKLCEEFGVSKNTIRRDIDELCASGIIKKVYGGVTAIVKAPTSFEERGNENSDQKHRIGKAAAKLVKKDDSIFIDSGTTTFQMVPYLSECGGINVFTNNIKAVFAAYPIESIHLYSLPGTLNPKTNSLIGADTTKAIEKYNINKAFLASTGLTFESGVTNSEQMEYDIKRAVIEKSTKTYLLIDSTKFGKVSLITFASIGDFDAVITDKMPAQEYVDLLKENNVELIIADE